MAYVVKGTPPGYDVNTAIEYLLSFNSGWPLLKVHDTSTFGGTVTHDLGYPPLHFLAESDGRVDQFAGITENYGVSTTQLARSSGAGSPRYFIFRTDLTTNFTAATIAGSTTKDTSSNDYVFKIAKDGKDVSSTDMRDFSLHSGTKSPMLHKVDHGAMSNTGGGLGRERTVAHGLGYTPIAFAFIQPGANTLGMNTTRYCIIPPPVGASGVYFTVDATNVYVTSDSGLFSTNHNVSVVVLKEPFSKETVSRTFP